MKSKNLQACKSTRRKTAWAVDYDYISKLNAEELQFLADFTNFFYHGSPMRSVIIPMSKELIAESYRRNNTSERDIYTKISKK